MRWFRLSAPTAPVLSRRSSMARLGRRPPTRVYLRARRRCRADPAAPQVELPGSRLSWAPACRPQALTEAGRALRPEAERPLRRPPSAPPPRSPTARMDLRAGTATFGTFGDRRRPASSAASPKVPKVAVPARSSRTSATEAAARSAAASVRSASGRSARPASVSTSLAAGAHEQRDPQLRLQPPDLLRQRRLRHVERVGGGAEACRARSSRGSTGAVGASQAEPSHARTSQGRHDGCRAPPAAALLSAGRARSASCASVRR